MPGIRKELLYIKEPVWGPAAVQVGPAPVFFAKFLELQANSTNTAPLSGRRSIEVGAGCGLVSMVAALMGAEAYACEEGAALAVLQHNVDTFNSEFSKCHPIRAGGLPTSEDKRGDFDLILVTDHLHSLSAQLQTVQTLINVLDEKTECVLAHTWRSQVTEEAFFKALGGCLMVERIDGHRSIQSRCSQPLSRSIADSVRDIKETTDEDGSIDIFSIRPHAGVAEEVWREDLKKLLRKLQQQDEIQTGSASVHSPPIAQEAALAATEAAVEWENSMSMKAKDEESRSAALSSCSTLSSFQAGPLSSFVSFGAWMPAESGDPDALSLEEPKKPSPPQVPAGSAVPVKATSVVRAKRAKQVMPPSGRLQMLSQSTKGDKIDASAAVKAPAPTLPAAKAAAAGAGSPTAATRVSSQTGTFAATPPHKQQQQQVQEQQRLPPGSLDGVRPSKGPSPGSPLLAGAHRLSVPTKGSGSSLAAKLTQLPAATPLKAASVISEPKSLGSRGAASPASSRPTTAGARSFPKVPAAKLEPKASPMASLKAAAENSKLAAQGPTGTGSLSKFPLGAAVLVRPTTAGATVPRHPVKQSPISPATTNAASKGSGSSLPSSGSPKACPQRTAVGGSPATHGKSVAGGATNATVSAALSAAASGGSAPSETSITSGKGKEKLPTGVKAGLAVHKPNPFLEKPVPPPLPRSRPSSAVGAAASVPAHTNSQGKAVAAAVESPGAPLETSNSKKLEAHKKTGKPSNSHITAAGPLGSRFVSRLSSLFKRSGSKDIVE